MNGTLGNNNSNMTGGGEVTVLAEELARAVELAMSPTASQDTRHQAYNACESFKEASPWCAQAGLVLASGTQYSPVVRHFGLQLMEHTVKYRWTQISQPEKLFIKENAMKLIAAGGWSESHMNDAIARVVVEMAKREWPQQWPTLLSELSDACTRGNQHTEIVLLVFLRLVEDVATLQTLESNQRRKDIYGALTSNMAEIFSFFLRLTELHVQSFRDATHRGDFQVASGHERVVQVVLLTLTGFVEWVSMNHIISQNGKLLQILCILLSDEAFQLPAAECLLQIVNRKGQVKERKPLLILLSEDAISCIHRAALVNTNILDEKHYLFLKKLSQVLAGLAQQLASLWGKEDSVAQGPRHLSTFLETVLLFSAHPSLCISHTASGIWSTLLKHEHAQKDPVLLTFIPRLVTATAPKLLKVSYPQSRPVGVSLDTASYAAIDFDSENEFAMFYCRCRTDLLDNFRQATMIAPLVTFGYADQWLRVVLNKAVTQPHNTNGNIQDPVYLEWEALSILLDSILSRILMSNERPTVQSGLALLELCLALEPQDPLLLSLLLSFISALFVFLSMSSCQITQGNCIAMSGVTLLPRVLDKIFAALVYTGCSPGEIDSKEARSRVVRNVRRHAASLMVKIGYKFPLLLLPVFDRIHSTIRRLTAEPSQLSTMERITLQEALLLISNHFCDYNRQKALIGEILGSCSEHWAAMACHFESAVSFMRFVGLSSPPVHPSTQDQFGQNRSHLLHCVNLLLGVIKRCAWPDDPDKASRGGFSGGVTAGGNPIWRNPCTEHVLPILPHVLALFRTLNQLYEPQAMQHLSEGYRSAYNMLEVERQNLLGLSWTGQVDPLDPHPKKPETTPLDRMQRFLSVLNESCCHMLGSASVSIGRELYQIPGIGQVIVQTVLCGLEKIPDYRLRPIVRVFLKPFISSCPPAFYNDVLMPILSHITPFMLNRLCNRWQYIMTLYESGKFEEDNNDTQEVIEDMLNRNLTREYLDVLKYAMIGGTITLPGEDELMDAEDSMGGSDANSKPNTGHHNPMSQEHIGELGNMMLASEVATPVVMTILSALWWNDTMCSLRACTLFSGCIKALASWPAGCPMPGGPSMPARALAAIFRSLQQHGQHDANQAALLTLGVQLYEALRHRCPAMLEVMQQIPNVNAADLTKLDEKLSAVPTKGNKIEKGKKDLFKKITSHLIGRSMGQLFRKEVHIPNLPQMTLPPKERTPSILDGPAPTGLANFFSENTIS